MLTYTKLLTGDTQVLMATYTEINVQELLLGLYLLLGLLVYFLSIYMYL